MAAKSTTRIVRTASPQTIRIAVPRAPLAKRAKAAAHRGARHIASAAMDEKHTLVALVAAGVLGFAQREGISIPHVEIAGEAGTAGLVAWAVGKWGKSRIARHVATGLLSIAVYEKAKGEGAASKAVSGDEEVGRTVALR